MTPRPAQPQRVTVRRVIPRAAARPTGLGEAGKGVLAQFDFEGTPAQHGLATVAALAVMGTTMRRTPHEPDRVAQGAFVSAASSALIYSRPWPVRIMGLGLAAAYVYSAFKERRTPSRPPKYSQPRSSRTRG